MIAADTIEKKIQPIEAHKADGSSISEEEMGFVWDGYHTFNELYDHRHALFLAVVKLAKPLKLKGFKSWLHEDGTSLGDDWFIAGIELPEFGQISYHLPRDYWVDLDLPQWGRAPWDGHTSGQVVERLRAWVKG